MASGEPPAPSLISLRDCREQAIARLSDAFANDVLDVEEFERRLTLAHRATSISEIDQTVADLTPLVPDSTPSAPMATPARAIPVSAAGASRDTVMAIFGGVERRGSWTLPHRLNATAVMGGIQLDFREAVLPAGITEIRVVAVMGGVELIVPPNLPVEVTGTAICGGFGHVERVPAQVDPDRPLLRVRGVAIFGGVAVQTRLPGESELDAHRRHDRHRALPPRDAPRQLPAKTVR
ncbi:MAG TPA: LiaF domain-containing protein [Polyangiaceae bacterium]|nr:LiaF domain-containing protein [Polyangiaceae bacterium]